MMSDLFEWLKLLVQITGIIIQTTAVVIAIAAGIGLPLYFNWKQSKLENARDIKEYQRDAFKMVQLGFALGSRWSLWGLSSTDSSLNSKFQETLLVHHLKDLNLDIDIDILKKLPREPHYHIKHLVGKNVEDEKVFSSLIPPLDIFYVIQESYGGELSDIAYTASLIGVLDRITNGIDETFVRQSEMLEYQWTVCIEILKEKLPLYFGFNLDDVPDYVTEKPGKFLNQLKNKVYRRFQPHSDIQIQTLWQKTEI